ncbi:MAG: ATP-binding protein [Rhizobium sp.]|nr:ATP-binding protein [Rhizobium sp.]
MHSYPHFSRLTVDDWRQFGLVDLDLSGDVTILTGVNGSGKTTLLRLLAYFTGEAIPFLATPQKMNETGGFEWVSGLSRKFFQDLFNMKRSPPTQRQFGELRLSNGTVCTLSVPIRSSVAAVNVIVGNSEHLPGFFIPSHRPVYYYEQLKNLDISKKTRIAAYQEYIASMRTQSQAGQRTNNISSKIKNAILNWGYVGYGSKVAPEDPELVENFEGFQNVLRKILPKELRFSRYEIRSGSEIVFVCEDNEFLFETASGGITSLIHLAWLIFTFSASQPCVILIDEIENHLHPSLQRIVLPNLAAAFPNVRFIVTTHSPLVVNSVRGATVYALQHAPDNKIVQHRLDFASDANTAAEILDQVLGVPVTMPVWAEHEYERIVDRYVQLSPDEINLGEFRAELVDSGLRGFVLQGVDRVLASKQ